MAEHKNIERLRWCWALSKPHGLALAIFYFAELSIIGSSLLFIMTSKRAIDYAISGDRPAMMNSLYLIVGLVVVNILLKFLSNVSNELAKMKMLRDLQNNVSQIQMYLQWDYIKNWSTGDIQYRIQRDCLEIIQMITQIFPNFTLTAIRLLASLSLLWVLDSRLALIILGITPLLLFSKLYYKKFRKLNKDLKKNESELSHIINENLKFRMLIKTLGIESYRWLNLNHAQNNILDLKRKILSFSLLSQSIVKITLGIGFLFTFIWGALGLSSGSITFGTMTAFLQLVGRVQSPMLGLLGFFPSLVSFGVSVNRVQEILQGKLEVVENSVEISNLQKLELCNVSFKYEEDFVFENLNLTFYRGKSTAIVGASGRGKTTLIRLLLSVITPQKGVIKIIDSSHNISFLNVNHRINFGYVPQGDKLFAGSIRDNLLLGNTSIKDEQIKEALYNSCSEFVCDLPEGIDTIVGESGYGLSEGQAQRIAIARTLLTDTAVWLFDEITSALDHDTAILLYNRIQAISNDKIVVFVTHDRYLAELCDEKYFMS